MMELNRVERRALRTAAGLIVLGTAVRLGCGPSPAEWAWRPTAEAPAGARPDLEELTERVSEATRRRAVAERPLAPGERIDPGVAPTEQLQRLPGIGPALAGRIVEHRETSGRYSRAEQLLEVSGIGAKTLARIRPHLRFSGKNIRYGGNNH
jgi:competence ComEA-like helix-hairpin-helix protein